MTKRAPCLQTRLMAEGVIPTSEVLARLRRAGLPVKVNMLKKDTEDGYLPHLPREHVGRREALWEPWAVRRALYLYRLRHRLGHRGIRGDLLRVLLFLRDGWGWDRVQPLCLKGARKVFGGQLRLVPRHLKAVTRKGLASAMDDIAPEAGLSLPAALFVYGLAVFGQPLEKASLEDVMLVTHHALQLGELNQDTVAAMERAERLTAESGMSCEALLKAVEAADRDRADLARRMLLGQLRIYRQVLHSSAHRGGLQFRSTNLLAFLGAPTDAIERQLRAMYGRPTRAQLAAALLAPFIFVTRLIDAGLIPMEDLEFSIAERRQ